MKLNSVNFTNNSIYIVSLLAALWLEIILENIGIKAILLPNFVMCIVFSFAFIRPVPLWLATISVVLSEMFFSSTPILMGFMILSLYFVITRRIPVGSKELRNLYLIIFILVTAVVYSVKILWFYCIDFRLEISLILIKMLVTMLLFPLFYLTIQKIVK